MKSVIDYIILGTAIMFAFVLASTGVATLSMSSFPSNLIQSAGFFATAAIVLWLFNGFIKGKK